MATIKKLKQIDENVENLIGICEQIATSLALDIDRENPEEVMGKMNELMNLLPSSAHAVSLAEMIYSEKIMQLTLDKQFTGMTATDKKMIFAGRAKKEGYFVTLTERQNKALVHAIEGLRTIISYIKEQMRTLPSN